MHLTITTDHICRVCGLDPDSDAADVAQQVIDAEQEVWEAYLRPDALADESLEPILRRAVTFLLAATVLDIRARVEPSLRGTVQASGVTISRMPNFAEEVRQQGRELLAPYWLRRTAVISPDTAAPTTEATQERAFGKSELRRREEEE